MKHALALIGWYWVVATVVTVLVWLIGRQWHSTRSWWRLADNHSALQKNLLVALTFLNEAGLQECDYNMVQHDAVAGYRILLGGGFVDVVGGRLEYLCPGGTRGGVLLPVDQRSVGIDGWRMTTLRRYVYKVKTRRRR